MTPATDNTTPLTQCVNKYAGTCNGRYCTAHVDAGEGVYLKGTLVCRACLQQFADQVATNKSARTVIRGNLRPVNETGLATGLLYWVIRQNGIKGFDRMVNRWRKV